MYTSNYLVAVLLRHRCAVNLDKIETIFKFKIISQKIYGKENIIKITKNLWNFDTRIWQKKHVRICK